VEGGLTNITHQKKSRARRPLRFILDSSRKLLTTKGSDELGDSIESNNTLLWGFIPPDKCDNTFPPPPRPPDPPDLEMRIGLGWATIVVGGGGVRDRLGNGGSSAE